MDVDSIKQTLSAFIERHRTSFHSLAGRETALLEMGALVMASEHYRLAGYTVEVENPQNNFFHAKLSSRGNPYNFSWFACTRSDSAFEIHSNLSVGGAHNDGAVYVVDVAVVERNVVPRRKSSDRWICIDNTNLITFVEVKKLVVYPMLLAQFVGIVHEIKPRLLRSSAPPEFLEHNHFYPALISLGYLKGTSVKILTGFRRRRYKLCVVHSFDSHLSAMRTGSANESPFLTTAAVI